MTQTTNSNVLSCVRSCVLGCSALVAFGAVHAESLVGKVMTVNGPVAPESLGITLPHEHLLMDLQPPSDTPEGWREVGEVKPATAEEQSYYDAPFTIELLGAATMGEPNSDNLRLDDEATAIKEATDYKWSGGGTIVDVTSIGIKRDPAALKRIADATGLNIVMGSGWYEHGYVGGTLDARSVANLADEIVRDLTVGVDGSGIRAGIIGEIRVGQAQQSYEKKILAAAARASLQNGAPISVHFARGSHEQLATLEVLKGAGADLSRVAMGRSNPIAHDMPLMKKILDQGAYLQFDLLGDPPQILSEMPDHDVAVAIVGLIAQGYVKQLLLSQNVSMKTDLKAFGGGGYSFINEQFIPYLTSLGATQEQIEQMVVGNPKRLLTFVPPRPVRN